MAEASTLKSLSNPIVVDVRSPKEVAAAMVQKIKRLAATERMPEWATEAHEALKGKFAGLEMLTAGPDGLTVTAKEISDISGDVSVAQRKGKIFCYFDIKFTLKYKARLDGETGEGKVTAPEVDHDGFRDEFGTCVYGNCSSALKLANPCIPSDYRRSQYVSLSACSWDPLPPCSPPVPVPVPIQVQAPARGGADP